MRSRAFRVVDEFEAALCEFTGAPYAVTVDSCTNALFLSFRFQKFLHPEVDTVILPKHTYVGVRQAAVNAGFGVEWRDLEWKGAYRIEPFRYPELWDSAKEFGKYWQGTITCLSFQAGKKLPIGRGGAILCEREDDADWFRRARLDGRTAGADYLDNTYESEGYHMYLDPPSAARGLWLMTYIEDNDKCDWTEYPDLSEATWN